MKTRELLERVIEAARNATAPAKVLYEGTAKNCVAELEEITGGKCDYGMEWDGTIYAWGWDTAKQNAVNDASWEMQIEATG